MNKCESFDPRHCSRSQQKRNTSTAYSSSLTELLQRKISALEQQLHHKTEALGGGLDHHSDDHGNDHSDHRHDEEHHGGGDDHLHDQEHDHDDGGNHTDRHDDGRDGEHHDDHGDGRHDTDHDDYHHREHDDHDGGGDDGDGNEADDHSYLPHTGYRAPHAGFHPNKLETVLNQLQHAGTQPAGSGNDLAIHLCVCVYIC